MDSQLERWSSKPPSFLVPARLTKDAAAQVGPLTDRHAAVRLRQELRSLLSADSIEELRIRLEEATRDQHIAEAFVAYYETVFDAQPFGPKKSFNRNVEEVFGKDAVDLLVRGMAFAGLRVELLQIIEEEFPEGVFTASPEFVDPEVAAASEADHVAATAYIAVQATLRFASEGYRPAGELPIRRALVESLVGNLEKTLRFFGSVVPTHPLSVKTLRVLGVTPMPLAEMLKAAEKVDLAVSRLGATEDTGSEEDYEEDDYEEDGDDWDWHHIEKREA